MDQAFWFMFGISLGWVANNWFTRREGKKMVQLLDEWRKSGQDGPVEP